MKIEVWSDFVCPFCYIGKRRLEVALEQHPSYEEIALK
ncbi:DsbA family oxidoreductase, partial [Bacillus sp. B-TM1]